MTNFLDSVKILTAMDAAGAGTTTLTGSIVIDTMGFEEVTMIASLGDVAVSCAPVLKVHQGDNTTTLAAITGAASNAITATATSLDLKKLGVTVIKPLKRYMIAVLERPGGNAVLNDITCILSKPRVMPTGTNGVAGDVVAGAIVAPTA